MKKKSKKTDLNEKVFTNQNDVIVIHGTKVNVIYSENGKLFADILKRYLRELKNRNVV